MSETPRTWILIQHCQSLHHVNREAHLWPDRQNGLSDFGRRQAECVAARLAMELDGRPCRVYHSPMQRAAETAAVIIDALNVAGEAVLGLHEFNGRRALEREGLGEEQTPEPQDVGPGSNDWRPCPGGETWREFQTRVSATMDAIVAQHDDAYLPIIVAHGGSLNCVVMWWLGLALDALQGRSHFQAHPGSLSVLRRDQYGVRRVERLNDKSHLLAAGLGDRIRLD